MARQKTTPSLPILAAASQQPAATPAPAQPQPPTPPQQPSPLITATANGSNHGTKVDLQAIYQAVIAGLLEFYQPGDVFQMSTGTYSRDELITEFQQFVSAAQNTKDSNAQWRSDIQTERLLELHVKVLRKGVKGIVSARFGDAAAQLLKFGFTLPKPRKKSAKTKAAAVQKGLATREARQTMGKVQKKDVKGNVNVQLVVTPGDGSQSATPATTTTASSPTTQSPAAAAPSATPAAAAPNTGVAPQPTAVPAAAVVPTHPGTNGQ